MKLSILLACILPLCLQAQQENVHIKAAINGLEAGKKIYLTDWNNHYLDSTTSVANGFQLDYPIPEGEGNSFALKFGRLNGMPNTTLNLYLEKGTVTINGNGPMFNEVQLSGPSFIDDLNNFDRYIQATKTALHQLYPQIETANKNRDSITLSKLYAQTRQQDSLENRLTNQWIEKHTSSPISTYLLTSRFFYRRIETQTPLFKKLKPAAINNALGKKLKEQVLSNDLNGIGKTAPGLALSDTAGKQVALKDFKGKYVLLDFWASWCHPCRQETPFLKKALQQYTGKNFTIVSVSIDTDTAKWVQAVRKDDMQWTNLIDPSVNRINSVLHGYYVPYVPTNLLIDPNGRIVARNLRGEEVAKKLEKVLGNAQAGNGN